MLHLREKNLSDIDDMTLGGHMRWRNLFGSLVIVLAGLSGISLSGCSGVQTQKGTRGPIEAVATATMQTFEPDAVNSEAALKSPYVVMVSIDGYRHDYNRMFNPPTLSDIATKGVQAESLIPVYPSKTFPNHYSIATGLYADRHGLVSNDFYDPSLDASYTLSDRKAVSEGVWYGGDPLWVAAGKQGMLTASFFWVGSEANVQQRYPNYYYPYDGAISNERRVDQVLEWLRLPEAKRPHLVLLYFSDVDSIGHEFGTSSPKLGEAVLNIDAAIAKLRQGLAASGLPVNLVVVSDHGMQDLDASKVILIDSTDEIKNMLSKFRVVGRGPQMLLYLNKGEDPKWVGRLQKALRVNAKNYRVFRRDQMKALHYASSPRAGDLIVEPDVPYLVGLSSKPPGTSGGNHGWNALAAKTMHGVFYAEGPAFKAGTKLPSFENVHVYPMVLEILGLKTLSRIDGKLEVTKPALAAPDRKKKK